MDGHDSILLLCCAEYITDPLSPLKKNYGDEGVGYHFKLHYCFLKCPHFY
jgi:hypothetical protein